MGGPDSREWAISVCGLNCAKCDIYEAGNGNDELRVGIMEWFRDKHNKIVAPEKVTCEGCRGALTSHWSPDCRMMLCAREKAHQFCFLCEDFPCKKVEDFGSDGISHHKRTVENSKRMKAIGIKAWLQEHKGKGSSVFCP